MFAGAVLLEERIRVRLGRAVAGVGVGIGLSFGGAVLPACGDGPPIVVPPPEGSLLVVELSPSSFGPEGWDGLEVAVEDGTQVYGLRGVDFRSVPNTGILKADTLGVEDEGQLRIGVVWKVDGNLAAEGSVTFALEPRFAWVVRLERRDDNPLDTCRGCRGGEGLLIAEPYSRSPSDALWIIWAGGKIGSRDPI